MPNVVPGEGSAAEASPADLRLVGEARLGVNAAASAPAQQGLAPSAQMAHAVAGQIAVAIGGAERDRIDIRLDPPELGRVRIEMRVADGALHAFVSAERPEVQELLRRYADALQRDLEAAGYAAVSMSFAGGDSADDAHSDTAGGPPAPWKAEPLPHLAPAPLPGAWADGRLDIRL